mgnify:CR=1 FL=1
MKINRKGSIVLFPICMHAEWSGIRDISLPYVWIMEVILNG